MEYDDFGNPIEPTSEQTDVVRQQREHIESLEKDLKQREREAKAREERIAKFEQERRNESLVSVFGKLGLKPGLISLYSGEGEVTEESVSTWAQKHDLVMQPQQLEVQPQEPEVQQTPWTAPVGGDAPSGAAPKLTHDEYLNLIRVDPVRALSEYQKGNVETSVQQIPGVDGWQV